MRILKKNQHLISIDCFKQAYLKKKIIGLLLSNIKNNKITFMVNIDKTCTQLLTH